MKLHHPGLQPFYRTPSQCRKRRIKRLFLEILEDRRVLDSGLESAWQNPLFALDVSEDGVIAPIDALNIINDLNQNGSRKLPLSISSEEVYLDVSGDGHISPIDALQVINHLNAPPPSLMIDQFRLLADTGIAQRDTITNDPRIIGHVDNPNGMALSAKFRIDRGPVLNLPLDASGNFSIEQPVDDTPENQRTRVTILVHESLTGGDPEEWDEGRAAALKQISFRLDTLAPQLVVNSLSSGVATSAAPTIEGRALDDHGSGVASVMVRVDGGAPQSISFGTDGRFTFKPTLAEDGSADGSHLLDFALTDIAGNGRNGNFNFSLDTLPPVIQIEDPVPGNLLAVPARLRGAVHDAGSRITRLEYRFEEGSARSVAFGSQGQFNTPLATSHLEPGDHMLTVTAQDNLGHRGEITFQVTLQERPPLNVASVYPANGTINAGDMIQPQVFFSRPVNPRNLTSGSIYATDPAKRLLRTTIVPRDDGASATLIFDKPLPPSSTITLHVNGSLIRGIGDEVLLDGDNDGVPGGEFTSTLSTVSLTKPAPPARITGRVVSPGPDLQPMTSDDFRSPGPDGEADTDDDYLFPISNARVYLLGRESDPANVVYTDVNGNFQLPSVPAGTVTLVIDGNSAMNRPNGSEFLELAFNLNVEPGHSYTVAEAQSGNGLVGSKKRRKEVYLPMQQEPVLTPIPPGPPSGPPICVKAKSAPGLTPEQQETLELCFPPGSVLGSQGKPLPDTQVGIGTVYPELVEDLLPADLQPGATPVITVQAPGAKMFSVPLQTTFPNVGNATPGTKLHIFGIDPNTGRAVNEGTATVSPDGSRIVSDPGSGIRGPGLHFLRVGSIASGPAFSSSQSSGPAPEAEDTNSLSLRNSQGQARKHAYVAIELFDPVGGDPTNSSAEPKAVYYGRTNATGQYSFFLPPETNYRLVAYDPLSNQVAVATGISAVSGEPTPLPALSFRDVNGETDADGDGLIDLAERAVGTRLDNVDTDADRLSDFIELQQGLNPLDERSAVIGVIATLNIPGSAKEIAFDAELQAPAHQTAYVAAGTGGVAVIDISRFGLPILDGQSPLEGQLPLPGDSSDIAISSLSQVAVVAADTGGLHFVDVSNSREPKLIRTINVPTRQVEVIDGVAYAVVGNQIQSYETLTGEPLATIDLPSARPITSMTHEGNFLYTMDDGRMLRAFEADLLKITPRGSRQLSQGGGRISVSQGIVFATALLPNTSRGGFVTVNVANPEQLEEISSSDVPANTSAPRDVVVANGSGLALLGGTVGSQHSVNLMNIADPANTNVVLRTFALPQAPISLAIASGLGFVTDGAGGLHVVNYIDFDRAEQPPAVTITGPSGDQLQEGIVVPIRVAATDDVQVRNVELLMNGQVVANDVSTPFELSAVTPAFADDSSTVTFQVRATDTGGHVGFSNTLTYDLTTDVTAPRLLRSSPDNEGVGFRLNGVSLRFDEPIDSDQLTLSGITLIHLGADQVLGGGDDAPVSLSSLQLVAPRRVEIRAAAPLPEGYFQLHVDNSMIADETGNVLAAPIVIHFVNYDLDPAQAIAWKSDADGDWNTATNWTGNRVPRANDTVIIDRRTANPTITLSSNNFVINNVISREALSLRGGSLTVKADSRVEGPFDVGNGAKLTADGAAAVFRATGTTKIDGANLIAAGGGQIVLPNALSYTLNAGRRTTTILRATGVNSLLDLSQLTNVDLGQDDSVTLQIEATGGGKVDLRSLAQLIDFPEIASREIQILADGPDSLIDLSAMVELRDNSTFLPSKSTLKATNRGTITAPALKTLRNVDVTVEQGGVLAVDSWESWTDGKSTLRGGTFNFTNLVDARGTSLNVDGGSLTLPRLADVTGGSINLTGAVTVEAPVLSQIDGASFTILSGGSLLLPNVTSYARSSATWRTDGAGSLLDLSNLSQIDVATGTLQIWSERGGKIDLRSVTRISVAFAVNDEIDLFSNGSGSLIDLRSLTTLSDAGLNSELSSTDQGSIRLGSSTTLSHVTVEVSGKAVITGSFTLGEQSSLWGKDGEIDGSLINRSVVRPAGDTPGRLTITGDYTQGSQALLEIQLGGTSPGQNYDQLVVLGEAHLSGELKVFPYSFFNPSVDDAFTVLEYAGRTGEFTITTRFFDDRVVIPTYAPTNLTLKLAQALRIDAPSGTAPAAATNLTSEELRHLFDASLRRWTAAGLPDATRRNLESVQVQVHDLPDGLLGATFGDVIMVDANAAGWGWFVDVTPDEDEESLGYETGSNGAFRANDQAASQVDLLTVLAHEVGHLLGLEHVAGDASGMMRDSLGVGIRRMPRASDIDALFAGGWPEDGP